MATCDLTKGFDTACLEGSGGNLDILFANFENIAYGITQDVTTGEIEGLPTATLYRYVANKNSITFTETPVVNPENGTIYYEQVVTFRLGGLSQEKRNEINILARAKVVIFIRTAMDKILLIGQTDGAILTGGNGGSGAAKADFHGYELTFTAQEPNPANFLEAYTTTPFDNFSPDITVSPAYTVAS